MRKAIWMLAAIVAGCNSEQKPEQFTLYRNSSLDPSVRIHWGTFDARESDLSYNRNNCEMAARLLNANVTAFREENGEEGPAGVGFWCERGSYAEDGSVPSSFDGEFPTDVPESKRVPA